MKSDVESESISPLKSEVESESDVESETSTLVYDHKPFTLFQPCVLAFAGNCFRPDAASKDITVERLAGGSDNRVIGISLHLDGSGDTNKTIRYILRIPRLVDADALDQQVATLQFLQRYCRLPVPIVIQFDKTEDNELDSPYMIQNRLLGDSLLSSFPNLDHEAKCKVAKELGDVFHQLLAVRSSVVGTLTFPVSECSLEAPFYVAPFELGLFLPTNTRPAIPYSNSSPIQSTLEWLTTHFQAQKDAYAEACPLADPRDDIRDECCTLASELDAEGWLTDLPNCLAHRDFFPRNILVNPAPDTDLLILSGVLDWDSAVLAPMFMACKPPDWIWAWQDDDDEDDDEDERTANDVPSTAEGRQLKQLFEEAAGQDYLRFAYNPVYRLARQLLHLAIDGINSSEDYKKFTAMSQEWESMRGPERDAMLQDWEIIRRPEEDAS